MSKKKLCSQNISRIFTFVYMSEKNTLFGKVLLLFLFLDIYFCPKNETHGLLENTTFFILYILLIFLLKENIISILVFINIYFRSYPFYYFIIVFCILFFCTTTETFPDHCGILFLLPGSVPVHNMLML